MKAHSPAYRAAIHPANVRWTQLRWTRFRLQGGRCAVCHLALGMRFHAHHRHYRTLGRETLNDIAIVHPWPCHWLADRWRRFTARWW